MSIQTAIMRRSLFGSSSAVISLCQRYRYRLDRKWDESLPPLAFGMLNPSTADHERNDPTIERCQRRARDLGFGSLIVWNLFAFRAADPRLLKIEADPVGPDNDYYIQGALTETCTNGGQVVVGWGTHGDMSGRHLQVLQIARSLEIDLYCLDVTNGGQPKHPLYISYERKPKVWLQMASRPTA